MVNDSKDASVIQSVCINKAVLGDARLPWASPPFMVQRSAVGKGW